ncbi:restriction endonuclease subunit S [Aeromonas rivipollensis]|uniref:restriction endonuclease subunit S n=1 Tax=Aeromonas rivipollensis TaxID=948519 RepID=UPI0038CF4D79
MSFNWPEFQLSDKCTIKSSTRIFKKEYVESGIPFMRSKDVIDKALGVFSHFELFISKERYQEIKRKYGSPQKGDLLISSVGNRSGWPYIVQNEGDFYFKDGNIIWMSEFNGLDPDFLAYWLKSDIGQAALASIMIGSAQKALTIDSLRKLWVSFPPFEYQQLSSNVLKILDKKIANNKEMNQTIEAMAQAIFKSWFVDFDPVKAKINGEKPQGMDEVTAALFPDKLVESELGLIPEGWEVKPFSKWVKITKGKNITKKTIAEGNVPVVAGGLKPAYFHNTHNVNGPAITISASGANAGFVNLYFENIWASDCSFISQSTTPLFFLQYITLQHNQKNIFDMQTGAAQPHIYPKDFERLMVVIPNEKLCMQLESIFVSFFGVVANNSKQNIELAMIRDTLRPKLLSGEIELGKMGDI